MNKFQLLLIIKIKSVKPARHYN